MIADFTLKNKIADVFVHFFGRTKRHPDKSCYKLKLDTSLHILRMEEKIHNDVSTL